VVGGRHDLTDPDRMQPLSSPEDSDDDVVELRARGEQVPALDGPAGDVDKADIFWHVAKFSAHSYKQDGKPRSNRSPFFPGSAVSAACRALRTACECGIKQLVGSFDYGIISTLAP
jgi:hypothetical protein